MRDGTNPAKEAGALGAVSRHRVVVPVYVPSLDGYFANAPEILRLCIESLHATTSGKADVTVISNGCIPEVVEQLQTYQRQGWIDQLVLNRSNRGKVDAVLSAARGSAEDLITISDGDVLFSAGWTDAVEDIFRHFPECGFAAPVPSPGGHWYYTSATLLEALLRKELRFEKVVPDADLDQFARSIGRLDLFSADDRRTQLIVRRNGASACVGCGHFVFTIRREVLAAMPKEPSLRPIEGNSEEKYLDAPTDRLGLWRLATTRAFARHMGNVPEPWMYDELRACHERPLDTSAQVEALPAVQPGALNWLGWSARHRIVQILRRSGLYRPIFRRLGWTPA